MAKKKAKSPTTTYSLGEYCYDMPSETYHSITGTYSSSQFKDLLDDEVHFIKKYVDKTIEREDVPAFSVGNYFHTAVLEPDKLLKDCAVFGGKVRRGAEWEKFKSANSGRVIVTSGQRDEAERLVESVNSSEVAMSYVRRGKPEVSLFVELAVYAGDIYAPAFNKVLDRDAGWIDFEWTPCDCTGLVVKVRADSLGEDFVLDLKSTSGNARSNSSMRSKISYYHYELSAALYLDMFSLPRGEQLHDFIWTFASKDYFNCKSYKASQQNIRVGRAKYMKAILSLSELIRTSWRIDDVMGVLEPLPYELEYLQVNDLNLI